jgi:hypothetical protein
MTPADPDAWERLGTQLHDAARVARQVADSRRATPPGDSPAGDHPSLLASGQRHRDVFDVDEARALDALRLAWGDAYDISFDRGEWTATSRDAGNRAFTGDTPDALTVKIHADQAREAIPPPRPAPHGTMT